MLFSSPHYKIAAIDENDEEKKDKILRIRYDITVLCQHLGTFHFIILHTLLLLRSKSVLEIGEVRSRFSPKVAIECLSDRHQQNCQRAGHLGKCILGFSHFRSESERLPTLDSRR